ncbi:MAG: hypothetical protein ACM3X1_06135 [Ignavibacteriales bacterium]
MDQYSYGQDLKGLEPRAGTKVIKKFVPHSVPSGQVNVQSHTILLNLKAEVSFLYLNQTKKKEGTKNNHPGMNNSSWCRLIITKDVLLH